MAVVLLVLCVQQVDAAHFKKLSIKDNYPNQITRKIVQDNVGYIWFATADGLYKYDGYQLSAFDFGLSEQLDINDIYFDQQNTLWIGSRNHGLLKYQNQKLKKFTHLNSDRHLIDSRQINKIISDTKGGLWVATTKGLLHVNANDEISQVKLDQDAAFNTLNIRGLAVKSPSAIYIAGFSALHRLDPNTLELTELPLMLPNEPLFINNIFLGPRKQVWVGTNQGLFHENLETHSFELFNSELDGQEVVSMTIHKGDMWVGTIKSGLYKITQSGQIYNYRYHPNVPNSLSHNGVFSLLVDDSDTLWAGTFGNGINYVNLNTLEFGFETAAQNSISCAQSTIYYAFYEDHNQNLWIASRNGLIKFNKAEDRCVLYQHEENALGALSDSTINHIANKDPEHLWVLSNHGFDAVEKSTGLSINQIENKSASIPQFIIPHANHWLIGSYDGLFILDENDKTITSVDTINAELNEANFYDYTRALDGQYYFATNLGLVGMNLHEQLHLIPGRPETLKNVELLTLLTDHNNDMWIGSDGQGLFHYDIQKKTFTQIALNLDNISHVAVNSIEQDNQLNLWLGTDKGLIKFNPTTHRSHQFSYGDGLQHELFLINSSYKSQSGQLFFGGRGGMNQFYPQHIELNSTSPEIALTQFKRFNRTVTPGIEQDGFKLHQPINDLQELTLSHKDYVISIEFAALDYADSDRNQYAYKLEGFEPAWNQATASNRSATYTNLPSGNYVFNVKAANKDGYWNETGKSIQIKVLPSPWYSWWAISFYVLALSLLILFYIHRKIKTNAKVTELLTVEVAQKTQKLEKQKQKIESLLHRKNELFSNVSHEFRTPLTLILGPLNQLLAKKVDVEDQKNLQMIKRNSNRLLTLIEQLLQLAQLTETQQVKRFAQEAHQHIQRTVDSFRHLAAYKQIFLNIEANPPATILASKHAIEIILGNLVSNAIKYTKKHGQVTVKSTIKNEQLFIQVSDTGDGLNEQQQLYIFERFKRLDSHRNLEGTGIGLAVVKDILDINSGQIKVTSKQGAGSVFSVSLPMTNKQQVDHDIMSSNQILEQLSQDVSSIASPSKSKDDTEHSEHKETVLVIEDNHDMHQYIISILKERYQCLSAYDGDEGVKLAIKYIPDIIISDIMMPLKDGFEVTRIIRSDQRTSHIPLMILTALDNKSKKIRGWRELIDAYLTKPFDSDELLAQLENIITIRNLLRNQVFESIQHDEEKPRGLIKKDQTFINKLNTVMHDNYHNANFLRSHMANKMALSERQLQRKLKALTNQNPMELLREFRLKKAKFQLISGQSISQTSYLSGFNSPSHFAQCFKAKYNMTPSQYRNDVPRS